ncbi:anti-phage ZorAB system protein ZorA [Phyllobacterium bourgognense]|uniref:Uncharacterized protein n=1 Tax=Phyllobacterium bourgognense TaxID=314236 RepID=A0A368Z7U3_9HYPH|nr:anti-phage ZorAB system protein ZorA [Phyllobacterium bourgognense]RCW87566.1 hypothetical protein C7476_101332 [Phyllobacterium bourgognense]
MTNLFWRGWIRAIAFWGIIFATLIAFDSFTGLDLGLVLHRVSAVVPAMHGNTIPESALANLSKQDFAFALAGTLCAVGFGLFIAFALMHSLAIRLSLWRARRVIAAYADRPTFAKDYESSVYPALVKHPLIGHAWREFDETLLKQEIESGGVIGNTVRPHSFIGYSLVRERFTGLKMIGSIPGYFVGIGLLLTFAGIVLALSKASNATTASLIHNDTPEMMRAMTDLLGVASFKFVTSIAGLGISIFLALVFKILVIGMEASFTKFCHQAETQLRYLAPQSIAAEMNETAKEQTAQLKEINSDRFFTRMGEQLSPQISSAFAGAIEPMAQSISEAMRNMASRSEDGVGELLDRFSTSVQGSAGTELKKLGETLAQMQKTLETTQKGLHGTGEEFATRMAEAADALRQTFDRANVKLDADLGTAASGASAKVEDAMGRVMGRMEEQIDVLMGGLSAFAITNSSHLNETRSQVADAQQAAVASIAQASAEASKALETGLSGALAKIAADIERFVSAMRLGEVALSEQASAIGDATSQTRAAASSFSKIADDVRAAGDPLLRSGERMSKASEQMAASIDLAASSLERGNTATATLASSLTEQLQELKGVWESYKSHFDNIDVALGRAVQELGEATEAQAATLGNYAKEMNADLAKVMDGLRPLLDGLEQNTDSIADSVEVLANNMIRVAAE